MAFDFHFPQESTKAWCPCSNFSFLTHVYSQILVSSYKIKIVDCITKADIKVANTVKDSRNFYCVREIVKWSVMWDFVGSVAENLGFLGCDAVLLGEWFPVF